MMKGAMGSRVQGSVEGRDEGSMVVCYSANRVSELLGESGGLGVRRRRR